MAHATHPTDPRAAPQAMTWNRNAASREQLYIKQLQSSTVAESSTVNDLTRKVYELQQQLDQCKQSSDTMAASLTRIVDSTKSATRTLDTIVPRSGSV